MLTTAQVLAENNFGDTRTGGLAGPMGLFLIIALATVTVLLIRNMNARLRRLPDRFPPQSGPVEQTRVETTVVDPTDGTAAQESPTITPNRSQQRRNG
ncbi:hypothetical protein [Micromonospora auratinigra]|uniref:Uncharacterized protein n=1 Tax=Micromonospora auratinigra TaxID=261654 RepID=A0A1A9A6J0_9ACTN|nr:hypothetical protein [Micromonospora auratinigra]SBT52093.1 hypothetical protein GA0070611_5481 [Micromonospora auratinigra]